MGWVTCSLRAQALNVRRNDMNYKLMEISQRLQDLQSFGSAIANGVVTGSSIAGVSSPYYNELMNYMFSSSQYAGGRAKQQTDDYLAGRGQLDWGYNQLAQKNGGDIDPNLIFTDRYQANLQEFAKLAQERVHKEEKMLQNEQKTLETQLKAVDAECEAVEKAIDSDIKRSAIKLA